MYTPIIDNPTKPSEKQIVLSQCSTLFEAALIRKVYTDKHFKKKSVLNTKSQSEAITAIAIERLKGGIR